MSSPPNSKLQQSTLVRYLLGQLSEQENARIDELTVSDQSVFDQLRNVENDLVDSYVASELSGEDLRDFEKFYLASPIRQQKVQFAKALRSAALGRKDDPVLITSARNVGAWPRLKSVFSGWPVPALAAVVILVCGYLFVTSLRVRDREASRVATTERTLQEAEQSVDSKSAPANSPGQSEPPAAEQPTVVSYLLPPPTRGLGTLQKLVVSKTAHLLELKLSLEATDFRSYRLNLSLGEKNRAVWKSGALAPHKNVVTADIPTEVLKAQTYSANLYGVGPSGKAELISTYAFEIVIE